MSWFQEWVFSGIRLSLPLIFAAYGGMLSERAGIANIALESYLLSSSFAAAATMSLTQSLPLSLAMGVVACALVGMIFSFYTVYLRANQIITGMAINILVMSIIPIISKALFDVSGQTPTLPMDQRIIEFWPFLIAAILVIVGAQLYFSKTVLGLRAWAAGENPNALATQGVSVNKTRFYSIMIGSLIASIGGIYLSIGAGSGYTRNMSAGRGYIALAALIFGRWKPKWAIVGCLIFGLADALQILLQSVPLLPDDQPIPTQMIQALPYVLTLLCLAGFVGRVKAPAAIE